MGRAEKKNFGKNRGGGTPFPLEGWGNKAKFFRDLPSKKNDFSQYKVPLTFQACFFKLPWRFKKTFFFTLGTEAIFPGGGKHKKRGRGKK